MSRRLDTELRRATPEGVQLGLRVAGAPVRGVAFAIDLLFQWTAIGLGGMVFSLLGATGGGFLLLWAFGVSWFYPVAFEVLRAGATPGKRFLGLQVVHEDGTRVDLGSSVLRNLLLTADFLPLAYAGGLVSMLSTRNFQRLGDLAAGTLVVYRDHRSSTLLSPGSVAGFDAESADSALPVAPSVALDRLEQLALVDFAARRSRWSDERAIEMTDTLTALTGANGPDGLRRTLGMAAWLVGRRDPGGESIP